MNARHYSAREQFVQIFDYHEIFLHITCERKGLFAREQFKAAFRLSRDFLTDQLRAQNIIAPRQFAKQIFDYLISSKESILERNYQFYLLIFFFGVLQCQALR